MVQAYCDTARDGPHLERGTREALKRLGISRSMMRYDMLEKVWFEDPLTEWVLREAKICVPRAR
jgi:hypothetical protein